MKLGNWRTAHFWMLLLTQACVVALLYFLLFSPAHVIIMAALALALLAMNPTTVATAEAWFPPSVLAKLSQGDLVAIVARGEAALLSSLTQPPAMQPTVVATETKSVAVTDMPVPPGTKSNLGALIPIALLAFALSACGSALDGARKAVSASATLGSAAATLVVTMDQTTEAAIASQLAKDHDAIAAQVAEDNWHAKRHEVLVALKTYDAVVVSAGAAAELAGQGKTLSLSSILGTLSGAYTALQSALGAYGVKLASVN